EVDFSGVKRSVSLDLVPAAKKDDYVLVHAGFAIQLLDSQDALETLKLFKEIYDHSG
ncbi:MAG TPA: HypC/HybG/HupF family hydrogenase formation chaperone, partial [Elusimicrobia bacterium]|nr:HypC/HybG/HupF family hydrogenase formation chaperone [Elusimicrobiota bacterium]